MADLTNESALGLPPLNAQRREVYAYYRLAFLEDGYPGRQTDDELHPHPIYGPYVIVDYCSQFKKSKPREERFRDAAKKVADAAIARMSQEGDALIFWYEPGTGVSNLPNRFYSCLTQARYLQALGYLYDISKEEQYLDAAHGVFNSLLVPVEEGGVMRKTRAGHTMIEEYAHDIPDYTLNGWTTALLLVHDFYRLTDDQRAHDLLYDSVEGIAELLPLYDVPELANSRYRLTGSASVSVVVEGEENVLHEAALEIPGSGTFPAERGTVPKWSNRLRSGVDGQGRVTDVVTLDLQLSMVSWPDRNAVTLDLTAPQETTVSVWIGDGEYRPNVTALVATHFTCVGRETVPAGRSTVRVEIPWIDAHMVAYPTTFGKVIAGRNHNQYHFIHIDTLRKLHALTGNQTLRNYAERWAAYPRRWPQLPEYAEGDLALDQYQLPPKEPAPAPKPEPQLDAA